MKRMEKRRVRRGQTGPAITLADVAREAGVSLITASRVVRSDGPISAKTRSLVEAAVRKVGYVPNRVAGSLASSGSDLVGVVLPSLSNIVFPDVLRGIHSVLSPRGYRPVVSVTDYSLEAEYESIGALLSWRPAALIVTGLEHLPEARKLMEQCGVPVVEVMDLDGDPVDIAVGMSNKKAGSETAKHLIAAGYRRIGFVGHNMERDLRANKRRAGFLATLKKAGIACPGEVIISEPSSVDAGRRGLARLLKAHPKLDAVYFSNDDMAIGGVFHCLAEGIKIPKALAIVGYNGLEIGQALPLPLCSVRTHRREIGERAARCILDRRAGLDVARKVEVPFELIAGATA
jgi:LacI family gluconate utilization system Gnt-I transcriptional repressor